MSAPRTSKSVPASYPPYHHEVGAVACRWFEINSTIDTCASCNERFNPARSVGRRDCWVHPGVQEAGVWSCCGNPCSPLCPLTWDQMRTANYSCVVGCRRADHHSDRQIHGKKSDPAKRREQRAQGWNTVLPVAHLEYMGIPGAHRLSPDHPFVDKVVRKYGLEFCAVAGQGPVIRSRLAYPEYEWDGK